MYRAGTDDDEKAAERVVALDAGHDFIAGGEDSVFGFLGLQGVSQAIRARS